MHTHTCVIFCQIKMSTIWEILFSIFGHLKTIYLCAGFIPRINKRREIQRIKEIQKKMEKNVDYTLNST